MSFALYSLISVSCKSSFKSDGDLLCGREYKNFVSAVIPVILSLASILFTLEILTCKPRSPHVNTYTYAQASLFTELNLKFPCNQCCLLICAACFLFDQNLILLKLVQCGASMHFSFECQQLLLLYCFICFQTKESLFFFFFFYLFFMLFYAKIHL